MSRPEKSLGLWVCSVLVCRINVVLTTKKVTRKVLVIKIAIFWTHPTLDECLTMVQMVQHHHPVCVTGLWVRSVLVSCINVVLTTKKVTRKVLAIKIAIFWTHPTPDECLTMVQMVQHHHTACVTGLWVRSVLVSRINVVLTTKKVTRKAKK